MTDKRFAAAIIGCGKIAGLKDHPKNHTSIKTHAQAYYKHPGFKLVAACDVDPVRLRTFSTNWEIEDAYLNIAEFNDESAVDVISVCSPTPKHFKQLEELIQAVSPPKVIFVEKPICGTIDELDYLEKLCKKFEVELLVNHTRRFDPIHKNLATLIRDETFGDLVMGHCFYYGGWLNNGTHLIDTLRMLIEDNLSVIGISPGKPGREADPCWDIELDLNGAPILIQSFDEKYYQLFEIHLMFELGRFFLRDFGNYIIVEKQEVDNLGQRILVPYAGSPWQGLKAPLYNAMDAIANFLKDEVSLDEMGATFPEARKTMQFVWNINETGGSNYAI